MKAKKSLGQNFLKSEIALKKIIEAGDIKSGDVILEIGPGRGALTKKLLEKAGIIIAVEKDRELVEALKEKLAPQIKSGSFVLVHDDILNFNPNTYRLGPSAYKIIANIPYNITGAILKKFLTAKNQPISMVIMVQHEVAKRIVARDKKESLLSISVKAYGEPKLIMKVPARYFTPAPKVDSAIIVINSISRKIFTENKINEEKFWEIVKAGFMHKRKIIAGNLKKILKDSTKNIFAETEIKGKTRAEDLSLEQWLKIARLIKE